MPYIAHAGIRLAQEYTAYEKNHWYFIKKVKGLCFHWRINDHGVYEVVCELINNKESALIAAKNIYVTALFNLLYKGIKIADAGCEFYEKSLYSNDNKEEYPESTFFWTPKCLGGGLGPDVYEVPESFDDYDKIYGGLHLWDLKFSVQHLKPELDFDNYDESYFSYSKKMQPLLNTIVQADSVFEIGLQMTLYCGLLEHLSEDKPKQPTVISEIEELIDHVNSSLLSQGEKDSLISYLGLGKNISARQKCKLLCEQYAKEKYGPYTTKQILVVHKSNG